MVRFLITVLVVQLFLIGYVFIQSYDGRVKLVNNSRTACERGKKDRLANAEGWRIAQAARLADGNVVVANRYADIAVGLENRGHIDCTEAFPDPSLI